MPLVKVYVPSSRTSDQREAIGAVIHAALIEAKAPAEGRFQLFIDVPGGSFHQPPEYKGITKSGDFVLIEITLNGGRSPEVKANLYRAIAEGIERDTGIGKNDVIVSLVEVTKEDWSFGGGISTYSAS